VAVGVLRYRKWSALADFDLLLDNLRGSARFKQSQNKEPTVGIVDSQSVRWGNNRSLNGIDGNKKVKGIKCYVVVDKNGFFLTSPLGHPKRISKKFRQKVWQ
jgi:putative transposase